jgi:hypothetical protein
LFDRGLLWVTSTGKVKISPDLKHTIYGDLGGRTLRKPKRASERPDPIRLARHRTVIARQSS